MHHKKMLKPLLLVLATLFAGLASSPLFAQDIAEMLSDTALYESVMAGEFEGELTPEQEEALYAAYTADSAAYNKFTIDNLWVAIAAALVFLMHLGFATLESGLTQKKNTVNILFKNTFIICAGILTYYIMGFNLMYPGDFNGFVGFAGFGIPNYTDAAGWGLATAAGYGLDMTVWTDFIFQAMFAATAATIVSGAVAERVKLSSFMIFVVILLAVAYPITGSWKWGGGFLDQMGFYDFAGSTLVHSVGGWAALAFVWILGPRLGKYGADGKVKPILGHSMPLAMIGVMLLWLGWFGFNGGSVLAADPVLVSFTLVTTSIAAAGGGVAAMFTSWFVLKKPDLSMSLNGILAGLVGITAGADSIPVNMALLVGVIAGVIVVFSVLFFDKIKIDDPVGAISVHLTCGIWGTLAVGFFGGAPIGAQFAGVASIGAFTFIFAAILAFVLKATVGIRVSEEEETGGLDIGEHGQEAYPDFQTATR